VPALPEAQEKAEELAREFAAGAKAALAAVGRARDRVLRCGILLVRLKALVGSQWYRYVERASAVPERTAYRWLAWTERVLDTLRSHSPYPEIISADGTISVDTYSWRIEELLWDCQQPEDMPPVCQEIAQRARELIDSERVSDTAEAVLLRGEDPLAADRAAIGRSKGGAGPAGSRKDHTRHLVRALHTAGRHCKAMGRDQDSARQALEKGLEHWPTWAVRCLASVAERIAKKRG